MQLLKPLLLLVLLGLVTSCTTPAERINDTLHEKDKSFISSNDDYMYNESKTSVYEVEGNNPLADIELRTIAFEYANALGQAQYCRDMAYSVRNTYDKNFKLAPNWFEEEKRYKEKAVYYDESAKSLEQKLKDTIKSKQSALHEGGAWVYHKLAYKEYLYKCYAGPYQKEWVYLFSTDGKQELWSDKVNFSEEQLSTLLRLTGTKYTVKHIRDYKM